MSGHFTDEEMSLSQKLKDAIKSSTNDDLTFFQTAYYSVYLKQYNCIRDVIAYRQIGEIPDYVKKFIAEKPPT